MWHRDFVAKMTAQDDLSVARAELAAEKQQREAAEQENDRLRKAARAFESDVRDVAGNGFFNWRLLLTSHCDRFAALLGKPEEKP